MPHHYRDAVEVDAGLRLVEERERRVERQQLEQLGALDLPAGEADVEVAVQQRVGATAARAPRPTAPAAPPSDLAEQRARRDAPDGGGALEERAMPRRARSSAGSPVTSSPEKMTRPPVTGSRAFPSPPSAAWSCRRRSAEQHVDLARQDRQGDAREHRPLPGADGRSRTSRTGSPCGPPLQNLDPEKGEVKRAATGR